VPESVAAIVVATRDGGVGTRSAIGTDPVVLAEDFFGVAFAVRVVFVCFVLVAANEEGSEQALTPKAPVAMVTKPNVAFANVDWGKKIVRLTTDETLVRPLLLQRDRLLKSPVP
jgi:hypothetical protein